MTEIKKGYDSQIALDNCDFCERPIMLGEEKVICGTGSSLIATYHPGCWDLLVSEARNPSRRPGRLHLRQNPLRHS